MTKRSNIYYVGHHVNNLCVLGICMYVHTHKGLGIIIKVILKLLVFSYAE